MDQLCPYTTDLHGLYLKFYSLKLFFRVRHLYGIHIGDQILIILIEFNMITIPDQKNHSICPTDAVLSKISLMMPPLAPDSIHQSNPILYVSVLPPHELHQIQFYKY